MKKQDNSKIKNEDNLNESKIIRISNNEFEISIEVNFYNRKHIISDLTTYDKIIKAKENLKMNFQIKIEDQKLIFNNEELLDDQQFKSFFQVNDILIQT